MDRVTGSSATDYSATNA